MQLSTPNLAGARWQMDPKATSGGPRGPGWDDPHTAGPMERVGAGRGHTLSLLWKRAEEFRAPLSGRASGRRAPPRQAPHASPF